MATRQGLNCTLSYARDGKRRAYRVRANLVQHGTNMLTEESQARTTRAFYPHRTTPQQFAVKVQLNGYAERTSLMRWLMDYAQFILDPSTTGAFAAMTVTVPDRSFTRSGMLITGIEWGDHVGSMLWEPTLVFETSGEPWDKNSVAKSRVVAPDNSTAFREGRYYYPNGIQLSGNDAPPDGTYVPIVDPNQYVQNTPHPSGDPSVGD